MKRKSFLPLIAIFMPCLLYAQEKIKTEEPSLNLDEITIIALGIPRQERALGYSVTTVKSDELNPNVTNLITALQGKVAGLNISGTSGGAFGRQKITLRGASTLDWPPSAAKRPRVIITHRTKQKSRARATATRATTIPKAADTKWIKLTRAKKPLPES